MNAIAPGYMATELTENMKEVNPKQYDEITDGFLWDAGEKLKIFRER